MIILKSKSISDYEIKINLKRQMEKIKINRFNLSKLTNTKLDTINRYYYNEITRVDLDILLRFCIVLQCNIDDILKITKKEKVIF